MTMASPSHSSASASSLSSSSSSSSSATPVPASPLSRFFHNLWHWPWWQNVLSLPERVGDERLGLTAGSLTFTTLISLVPLLTVMLALFTAFPIFASFQVALEKYFLKSLIPETIARPVLASLTQFAAKANRLRAAGLVVLGFTALALMLTIDRTLN